MRVAVQPCSNPASLRHYQDTISSPVSRIRIASQLSTEQMAEYDATFGPEAAVWGVKPGKSERNSKLWEKLRIGDVVLFYRDRRIFAVGRIGMLVRSFSLAQELWGLDDEDQGTWEYMYFLDQLQDVEIGVLAYNRALWSGPASMDTDLRWIMPTQELCS